MRNTIGVILAAFGLALAVWGCTGSERAAAGAGGVVLFVSAVAVLIDLGG